MAQGGYIDQDGNYVEPDNPWQDPAPNPGSTWDWPNNDWNALPPPDTAMPPSAPYEPPPAGPIDNNPLPRPDPGPAPPTGGVGGAGGSSYGSPSSFAVSDSWPQFHAPAVPTVTPFANTRGDFTYHPFAEPAPFSYDSFKQPSIEDAQSEPGYAFARDEGQRAFLNSRLGTRHTGGTIKDFIGWGNKFAEQTYGNVYNRSANTYGINRGNAFENFQTNRNNSFQSHQADEVGRLGAYNTNFGADKDVYDRNTANQWDTYDRQFRSGLAEFDPRFQAASLTFADIAQRDRDKLDSLTRIATAGAGV